MSTRGQDPTNGAHDTVLATSEIRLALDRLLESKAFRAAHGQRKFLKYVVEETIAGRGNQIKEFTVGVEAFDRGESFDPRVDPIIRTEARKLRARLTKYYDEEGRSDSIRIELHKGSYIPVFQAWSVDDVVEPPTPEPRPDLSLEPPSPAPTVLPDQGQRRNWLLLMAVVAFGAAGVWSVSGRHTVTAKSNCIAVMPLANRSGDPNQNAIVDGITTSLIQLFERESDMRVIGRVSVSRLASGTYGVAELKQRLKVNAVLIGGIEKRGETLRLRVRLAERSDAAPLWSGSYTFDPELHEAIENEIAAEVLHVLRTGKPVQESAPVIRTKIVSSAWSAYLQGLHLQGKLDATNVNLAIERFEKAIAHDPSFARAHAALANSWVIAAQVSGIPPAEVSGKIRQFATRALQLDPTLGDPHFSLAVCAQYEYDWAAADREFRTGLALSPSSSLGHLWYARYLAIIGRHREVLVHRTISAELDPLSPYALQSVAGYWSVMGEYQQAINGFQNALALDPEFGLARQGLGIAFLLAGQSEEAIKELRTASSQRGIRTQSLLGYAYGMTGRTKEAREMLADFEERERHGPFPALAIAHVHIGLGNKDRAFEWLEKAVDQRDLSATLKWDSLYEPLRSDLRYARLLRRMKLAENRLERYPVTVISFR